MGKKREWSRSHSFSLFFFIKTVLQGMSLLLCFEPRADIMDIPLGMAAAAVPNNDNSITNGPPGDFDRTLVGSLVDSYNFKRNGLVKKTISITADNGRQYH